MFDSGVPSIADCLPSWNDGEELGESRLVVGLDGHTHNIILLMMSILFLAASAAVAFGEAPTDHPANRIATS